METETKQKHVLKTRYKSHLISESSFTSFLTIYDALLVKTSCVINSPKFKLHNKKKRYMLQLNL